MPGVNAATMSGGSYPASVAWRHLAEGLARKVADFDEWMDRARDAIKTAVQVAADRAPGNCDLDVYAAGYSPREGRCEAFVFAHDEDYAPVEIEGMHVRPAPPDIEPTDIERRRTNVGTSPGTTPAEVPRSVDGWAALARQVHEGRACAHPQSNLKLPIGGAVSLATLTADDAHVEVIHEFTSDDFRRATFGTLHPFGQVGPCVCGSGRRFLDCHLAQFRPLPCLCESGKTLGDCCALDADDGRALLEQHPELRDLSTVELPERPAEPAPKTAEYRQQVARLREQMRQQGTWPAPAAKVGRNDPCPGGCGRNAKRCACATVPA